MTLFQITTWFDSHKEYSAKAWEFFLQQYNRLIMVVISRIVHDTDDKMDLFTFVLENLMKDSGRKLTSYFDIRRNYSFETWISVVTKTVVLTIFGNKKVENN